MSLDTMRCHRGHMSADVSCRFSLHALHRSAVQELRAGRCTSGFARLLHRLQGERRQQAQNLFRYAGQLCAKLAALRTAQPQRRWWRRRVCPHPLPPHMLMPRYRFKTDSSDTQWLRHGGRSCDSHMRLPKSSGCSVQLQHAQAAVAALWRTNFIISC